MLLAPNLGAKSSKTLVVLTAANTNTARWLIWTWGLGEGLIKHKVVWRFGEKGGSIWKWTVSWFSCGFLANCKRQGGGGQI